MVVVVIAITSVLLALNGPVDRWLKGPLEVGIALAIAVLLPPISAALFTRRAVRALDRYVETPARGQAIYHRGATFCNALIGLLHLAVLLVSDWRSICSDVPVVGAWIGVADLLAIGPFLLTVLLTWTAFFPADRAVRQIALEMYLLRGRPVRPVWSLRRYLEYSFRHQVLFVLVPMAIMVVATDAAVKYDNWLRQALGFRYAPDLLIGGTALFVALIAPELLRRIWVTHRLPDGPLRDRLEVLARKLKLRFRDILVWRSGGMVVNAAVMGLIPQVRYVLITDAMLEQLDDTRIEAVFGHEAGHVRHHHLGLYLLFALISGCLVTVFSVRTAGISRSDPELFQWLLAGLGAAVVLKWGVVFGWISRRFERQADTFGVRALSLSGLPCELPCALHASPTSSNGAAMRDPLCQTGAHIFASALNEVAVLNGIQPESRSWRHSSIASRSRFVQRLAREPWTYHRFQWLVRLIQGSIVLVSIGSIAWAGSEMRLWPELAGAFERLVGMSGVR